MEGVTVTVGGVDDSSNAITLLLFRSDVMTKVLQSPGGTGAIWTLPPELVAAQGLGQGLEAVVTPTAGVCTWLQLRFGGRPSQAPFTSAWLDAEAEALPAAAPLARLS
jgi:hypothetical protein